MLSRHVVCGRFVKPLMHSVQNNRLALLKKKVMYMLFNLAKNFINSFIIKINIIYIYIFKLINGLIGFKD